TIIVEQRKKSNETQRPISMPAVWSRAILVTKRGKPARGSQTGTCLLRVAHPNNWSKGRKVAAPRHRLTVRKTTANGSTVVAGLGAPITQARSYPVEVV